MIGTLINNFEPDYSYRLEDLPSTWTFVWQSYYWLVAEDVVFTLSHRTLHRPWFYKHIHKQHHQYTHSVSIAGEHAHPVEFIMGNVLPIFIPGIILGKSVHAFTFMMIASHRIILSTTQHSGYDLPIKLFEIFPFRSDSRYHDYHHAVDINSNFGAIVVLSDYMMGYNHAYFKHLDTTVFKDKGNAKVE